MAGSIPANADVNADSLGLVFHEIPVAMPTFGVIDVGECVGDDASIENPFLATSAFSVLTPRTNGLAKHWQKQSR